jgi:hypothetical protein
MATARPPALRLPRHTFRRTTRRRCSTSAEQKQQPPPGLGCRPSLPRLASDPASHPCTSTCLLPRACLSPPLARTHAQCCTTCPLNAPAACVRLDASTQPSLLFYAPPPASPLLVQRASRQTSCCTPSSAPPAAPPCAAQWPPSPS